MSVVSGFRARHGKSLGVRLLATVLVATMAAYGAPAAGAAPDRAVVADCPAPVPLSTVTEGMVGEGWTVVRGTEPQPFVVTVLGVIPGAISAGRDLILVEVSDLPDGHVIDQGGGGIWAGMSGSPVYVDGKLLGALAYGFAGPSPIGGLTPAEDMYDVLDLRTAAARPAPAPGPEQIAIPPALRRSVAARAGTALPSSSLRRIQLPLMASGLTEARLSLLRKEVAAAGLTSLVVSGGRAAVPAPASPLTRPEPGGNLAATLSYGDLTLYGAGTTTAVCGDQALGFGHPMLLQGPPTLGADNARSVAVISDIFDLYFKLAVLTTPAGTIDQDRLAGIRADLRSVPRVATVTTTIEDLDTGRRRTGVTTVTDQTSLAGVAAYAMLANYDVTFEDLGDGRANSRWTISGTRAGGAPFTVSRFNRWAARSEVTIDPAFDAGVAIDAITSNEFEDVRIDRVTLTSQVSTRYQQLRIVDMAVSVNGGRYVSRPEITVPPRAKLAIRVGLKRFRSDDVVTRTLSLTVPASARGQQGVLSVTGGVDLSEGGEDEGPSGCLLSPEACGDNPGSLDAVLNSLLKAPHNNDLTAALSIVDAETGEVALSRSTTKRQRFTVRGDRSVLVQVRP